MHAEGRVYSGLTPEQRHGRRRVQFLDAGLEVFADHGWDRTTVLDLCRRARLSQRYFYEHFSGREALYSAVLTRIEQETEAAVRAAASRPDRTPEQRAGDVLGVLAGLAAADPRAIRVAFVHSYATPELRAQRARLLASFSALGAQLMRALNPQASRRDLELGAAVLAGGLAEALVAAASGAPLADEAELLDVLTRLFTAAARMEPGALRREPDR